MTSLPVEEACGGSTCPDLVASIEAIKVVRKELGCCTHASCTADPGSPTCYQQIATKIQTCILANHVEDRALCFHEVLEPHACQNLVVKCEALRMITQQLHLSSALVCPNQGDVAMWVEGARTNEREGMSSNECLLRQKGIQGTETSQRKTDTDQECAKQCIMEGYYICDYWTWDYDTEMCQWFSGQYEPTFDTDVKLSGVIYDAETKISGKWNCLPRRGRRGRVCVYDKWEDRDRCYPE